MLLQAIAPLKKIQTRRRILLLTAKATTKQLGRNRRGRPVHGILLLDKPSGGSSNHALQRAKRVFDAKKAGHTGSLDPLATGMLPICFGEATKLSAFLLHADKGYETTMQLGLTTDSADADGEVLQTRLVPEDLSEEKFKSICKKFKGHLQQIPPMVSAIKIDGKRLYKLAREGIVVDRPARSIIIHELEVLSFSGTTARLSVKCSKGTYIRSLVTDIGEAIGCGAHVAELRRTFVSPFEQRTMIEMGSLELMSEEPKSSLDELLLPLDAGLAHLCAVQISEEGIATFRRGQSPECLVLQPPQFETVSGTDSLCRVYDKDSVLLGLGELSETGEHVAPRRVLQMD
jgi:tRNA pseudouridine55 synthase